MSKLKPGIKPDNAWDDAHALMSWEPQSIDSEVLKRAREIERRYLTSWWDATIAAAAEIQSCNILLSENFNTAWSSAKSVSTTPSCRGSKIFQAPIQFRRRVHGMDIAAGRRGFIPDREIRVCPPRRWSKPTRCRRKNVPARCDRLPIAAAPARSSGGSRHPCRWRRRSS
jgi:hypothetical protein